jgi:hypothetical protein
MPVSISVTTTVPISQQHSIKYYTEKT